MSISKKTVLTKHLKKDDTERHLEKDELLLRIFTALEKNTFIPSWNSYFLDAVKMHQSFSIKTSRINADKAVSWKHFFKFWKSLQA